MKLISAVLVLIAGLATLVVSTFIRHHDTQLFIGAVGLVVAVTGLGTWGLLMFGDSPQDGRSDSSTHQLINPSTPRS